ncbi:hypothetical protein C0J52_00153 [Blattella germanica]|nr:hypothetical protein C0J52_00153 [Blattella germanica]
MDNKEVILVVLFALVDVSLRPRGKSPHLPTLFMQDLVIPCGGTLIFELSLWCVCGLLQCHGNSQDAACNKCKARAIIGLRIK